MVKKLPANAGDTEDAALIPGLGRSPGEGNSNPLQYSGLELKLAESDSNFCLIEPLGLNNCFEIYTSTCNSHTGEARNPSGRAEQSLLCTFKMLKRPTVLTPSHICK